MSRSFAAFGLAGCLLALGVIAACGQEPMAQVRASIAPGTTPWVGQKVILNIQLLAPGYFASAPRFDFPEIPGVLVVPPEGRPVLGTEQIGGQNYTVQSYEVALFAKRAGPHDVPPFKIRFNIKRAPLDHEEVAQEVMTPAVSFTANFPPGAENLTSLISAHDLNVVETWEPVVLTGKVGDAFTRTLTFKATGIPGMAFPPFPASAIPGVGIYPKPPIVSDQSEQGELSGQRRDTIVYVCEQPGHFTIPEAKLTWWNVNTQTLQTIDFPAHTLDIVPNPAFPTTSVNPNSGVHLGHISRTTLVVTAGMVALLAFFYFTPTWIWHRVRDVLRPIHLEPLNPVAVTVKLPRAANPLSVCFEKVISSEE